MTKPFSDTIPAARKSIYRWLIVLALVCAGLAVIAGINWASTKKILDQYGKPDFNTLAQDEIREGMIVTGNIHLAIDCYAEEYETNSGVRASGSEVLYYVVPVCDIDEDGTFRVKYFVTYKAEPGDYAIMDELLKQTWSDIPSTATLTLKNATIERLPDEVRGWLNLWISDKDFYRNGSFIDWCIEYGVLDTQDREVIKSKLTRYMICRMNSPGSSPDVMFICAGLSALLFDFFIILK
jgi:hypothetical protein